MKTVDIEFELERLGRSVAPAPPPEFVAALDDRLRTVHVTRPDVAESDPLVPESGPRRGATAFRFGTLGVVLALIVGGIAVGVTTGGDGESKLSATGTPRSAKDPFAALTSDQFDPARVGDEISNNASALRSPLRKRSKIPHVTLRIAPTSRLKIPRFARPVISPRRIRVPSASTTTTAAPTSDTTAETSTTAAPETTTTVPESTTAPPETTTTVPVPAPPFDLHIASDPTGPDSEGNVTYVFQWDVSGSDAFASYPVLTSVPPTEPTFPPSGATQVAIIEPDRATAGAGITFPQSAGLSIMVVVVNGSGQEVARSVVVTVAAV